MPNERQVISTIRSRGGAAHLSELGGPPARDAVDAALRSGRIVRVRLGWYALTDASTEVVRAVRVGGVLTAGSAAGLAGAWVPRDGILHVRVPRNASRLRAPDGPHGARLEPVRHRVCVHYRSDPAPAGARDALPIALAEMLRCSDADAAIAAVDSALARGLLSTAAFAELRSACGSDAARSLLDRASGGSESGIETKVRLLLRSRRVWHRTQVRIEGVGRVDLLVGDRLVIEVDGSAFHSGDFEFENDRRRDFELAMRGYLVLRLSYRMVVEHWGTTRSGILELIERGEHRWGFRAIERERRAERMPGLDRVDDSGPESWGLWR